MYKAVFALELLKYNNAYGFCLETFLFFNQCTCKCTTKEILSITASVTAYKYL